MVQEWNRAQFTIDNILHDETNILNGLQDFLEQSGWELATWSAGLYGATDRHFLRVDRTTQPRWQYNADGPTQYSGLRIRFDADPQTTTGLAAFSGQQHIVVQTFLENQGETDRQVVTPDFVGVVGSGNRFGSIRVGYDNTAPNVWLVVGGEDGLYFEVGRDSSPNNLGHGAVMTFAAIPENYSALDHTVLWTAQGLVCDLFGACRFTEDRNDRFVTDDGSSKNFTASLQPYSPRGTRSILTPTPVDQRPYYIGSRDLILGAGRGGTSAVMDVSSPGTVELKYHATLGLLSSPEAGTRYKISPLLMVQDILHLHCGVTSTSASDAVAVSTTTTAFLDPRHYRQIPKFAAVDHTLIPWLNVQDAVTGGVYRVARMEDNGRFSQLGVIWPSSALTVSLT